MPKQIVLEASSMCQLRCPLCDASRRKRKGDFLGWGYLTFKNFKKIVDKNPQLEAVGLSCKGELFLNPELDKIIAYAFRRGIRLSAMTNLNVLSRSMAESLVLNRFSHLSVSIDGVDEETYQTYRRGGRLSRVLEHIETINRLKTRHATHLPMLEWCFVVFGHNQHQLLRARLMARRLRMAFRCCFSWDESYSPVTRQKNSFRRTGLEVTNKAEFEKFYGRAYVACCHQLWDTPFINWDGKLIGCSKNTSFDFGNVFSSGLKEALHGPRYQKWLRGVVRKRQDDPEIPCSRCDVDLNEIDLAFTG